MVQDVLRPHIDSIYDSDDIELIERIRRAVFCG